MKRLRLFLLTILLGKEVQTMAVVYATLIIKGKKTLDQVPALIKPQVEEILKDLRSRDLTRSRRGGTVCLSCHFASRGESDYDNQRW